MLRERCTFRANVVDLSRSLSGENLADAAWCEAGIVAVLPLKRRSVVWREISFRPGSWSSSIRISWRGVQARKQVIKAALFQGARRHQRGRALVPHHHAAVGILMTTLELGQIAVEVVKKDIKNIHLSVYPPAGRVLISAPHRSRSRISRP
ncbi:hypothetical protein ACKWRH_10725 [Bradyrhizobium sp. Pa8]|uniref:hypothetical protein n=1 Tax=Bradyrhizobium sp. Pa8 TaxID=3386552 RepID=UPI00403F9D60